MAKIREMGGQDQRNRCLRSEKWMTNIKLMDGKDQRDG